MKWPERWRSLIFCVMPGKTTCLCRSFSDRVYLTRRGWSFDLLSHSIKRSLKSWVFVMKDHKRASAMHSSYHLRHTNRIFVHSLDHGSAKRTYSKKICERTSLESKEIEAIEFLYCFRSTRWPRRRVIRWSTSCCMLFLSLENSMQTRKLAHYYKMLTRESLKAENRARNRAWASSLSAHAQHTAMHLWRTMTLGKVTNLKAVKDSR